MTITPNKHMTQSALSQGAQYLSLSGWKRGLDDAITGKACPSGKNFFLMNMSQSPLPLRRCGTTSFRVSMQLSMSCKSEIYLYTYRECMQKRMLLVKEKFCFLGEENL